MPTSSPEYNKLYVRALPVFVEKQRKTRPIVERKALGSCSILVLDTETSVDELQNLMFGSCVIYTEDLEGALREEAFLLFYPLDQLTPDQVDTLRAYAEKHGYSLLTRTEFVEQVFIPRVYGEGAKCVGFNLPYDLSRLAIRSTYSTLYKGGFALILSDKQGMPRISYKSLGGNRAFIGFVSTIKKNSEKKYGHNRGYFLDLSTFTYVLTGEHMSLKRAAEAFGCKLKKPDHVEHGEITEEYIGYNENDTRVTYELYQRAMEYYKLYRLGMEPNKLYSPAGLVKAITDKIGIKPFRLMNPDFPPEVTGFLVGGYYGGRCGVGIRKTPVRATYLDYLSMYPSKYVLFKMERYLKAEKIICQDSTEETQRLLDQLSLWDIQDPEIWPKLVVLCKVTPNMDILPARSDYGDDNALTIGINYIVSDGQSLWYTLPDLIASKLPTGKAPRIERAISFIPGGVQEGLQDIELLSGIPCRKDEDFVKKLIEERIRIKDDMKTATGPLKDQMKIQQKALKIIANSLYGSFVRIDTEKSPDTPVKVYGLETFETTVDKFEKEGPIFNPIIAIFLTAGARLILATAEKLVTDAGGYVAYYDTDSIIISPQHEELVMEFFRPLNPYNIPSLDMFKVEKDDFDVEMRDVRFYAISAKRYVVYDRDPDNGKINIRKYSSHGLGGLVNIDEKQHWRDILEIHYNNYTSSAIDTVLKKYRGRYAVAKLDVSTFEVQQRIKSNKGKSYREQIKPANFITVGVGFQENPGTGKKIVPMLPYIDKNSPEFDYIPYMPFWDYKTGRKYRDEELKDDQLWTKSYWKPMSRVVRDYINHPESKSEGDIGQLKRRVIRIKKGSIKYIGKETNEIDQAEVTGVESEYYTEYVNWTTIIDCLTVDLALALGLSRRHLIRLKKLVREGKPIPLRKTTKKKILKHFTDEPVSLK